MIEPAPVTAELIDNSCENIQYHVFEGTTCTVCCVTLPNGYAVIGKSACVRPEDFDKELGEKYALEVAMKQVGDLLAYDARSILSFQDKFGEVSAPE